MCSTSAHRDRPESEARPVAVSSLAHIMVGQLCVAHAGLTVGKIIRGPSSGLISRRPTYSALKKRATARLSDAKWVVLPFRIATTSGRSYTSDHAKADDDEDDYESNYCLRTLIRRWNYGGFGVPGITRVLHSDMEANGGIHYTLGFVLLCSLFPRSRQRHLVRGGEGRKDIRIYGTYCYPILLFRFAIRERTPCVGAMACYEIPVKPFLTRPDRCRDLALQPANDICTKWSGLLVLFFWPSFSFQSLPRQHPGGIR